MKGYSGINDNGCIATIYKVDNIGTLLTVVNNWSNCVEHRLKTVQVCMIALELYRAHSLHALNLRALLYNLDIHYR